MQTIVMPSTMYITYIKNETKEKASIKTDL